MTAWQLGLEGVEDAWDALAGLFEARGATLGVEPGTRGEDGPRRVVTFPTLDRMIMDAVGAWLDGFHLEGVTLMTRVEPDGAWHAGWRAVFPATQVSERLWVRPAWEAPVAGRRDIVIDPTRAFGAGFHPTTAACLRLTDQVLARLGPGAAEAPSVLDVGTGTGILAIAAAHLGARVVGVEIDAVACADAVANAALNGVADRIVVVHGTVGGPADRDIQTYDVVLANVLATVLTKLAPTLKASARHAIVLSGIQESQEAGVLAVYLGGGGRGADAPAGTGADAGTDARGSFTLAERIADRGWVTLWLERVP